MAKSSKSTRFTSNIEFVNYKMDAAEKKAFKSWYKNEPSIYHTELINLVAAGYKSSVSYSDELECFTHSLTCQDETSPNYNKCLTSRSDDYWEAMAISMFKHLQLSEGGIWVFESAKNNWG
jgi:hypothetical protein